VRLVAGLLPWLGDWGRAVGEHHERWDGTGYPKGLAGDDIGYAARIVAVADSFETMTAARSYSKAMSADQAREELTRCAGSQFDPAVVRAFLGVSVGRLRWVLGPLTWLAEVPFVATADRAGQAVKAGAIGALVGGLVTLGVAPGPDGLDSPFDSPLDAQEAPAYTGLTESSSGQDLDGDAGVGAGGGLGAGTTPRNPLGLVGAGTSGLQRFGGAPAATGTRVLGFGGVSNPGDGPAGGRGAGDGTDVPPQTTGVVGFLGPLPVIGPGFTFPSPTGSRTQQPTDGDTVPAPAPAPVLPDDDGTDDAGGTAGGGGGTQGGAQGAGTDDGQGDGSASGGAGTGAGTQPASPAQPAQPGGPGQPARPAQPAQPAQPARDKPADKPADDDADDDDKRSGKDAEDDGAGWGALPSGPPADLGAALVLVAVAAGAGAVGGRALRHAGRRLPALAG
jgi:hypothetical protein